MSSKPSASPGSFALRASAAAGIVALLLVLPSSLPLRASAEAGPQMTTADYLDLPELFQVSVVAGSMAMLARCPAGADDAGACACYERFSSPEDVAALVALHARRTPGAYEAPFADTLIAALDERCATN